MKGRLESVHVSVEDFLLEYPQTQLKDPVKPEMDRLSAGIALWRLKASK